MDNSGTQAVLFLCHRIPFPPNKGEKIAAFNILKYLHRHYRVHLGYFVDDPFDEQYIDELDSFCESQFHHSMSRKSSLVRGATAFLSNQPITVPYYYRPQFAKSVERAIAKHNIKKVVIFSGAMAQYVFDKHEDLHTVMNFVDIDSDKWRQYSDSKQGLSKFVYQREHQQLQRYEIDIATRSNVSCFVTPAEVDTFKQLLPSSHKDNIQVLENGLDNHFFNPDAPSTLHEDFPIATDNYLVFTGAMDYWANVDAVKWFVTNVWPSVLEKVPTAHFYIVGGGATADVKTLESHTGVVVTNRVVDIRPYLQHAKAVVAPMQIARGVQNKILEAMAMAKPVFTTTRGIEGISGYPTAHNLVTNDPQAASNWCVQHLIDDQAEAMDSREWIIHQYSWPSKLAPLQEYLDESRF
jgi:sugar transferase (PEP-CTERM/EpsH1 system associated)